MNAANGSPAWRLALVYIALFLWMGVYLPYWPVWLAHRGMSPSEVGILLGVAPWTRVLASPVAGRWADRSGNGHRLVQVFAAVLVLAISMLAVSTGFASLLGMMVVLGLVFAPLIPLVDGITLEAEAEGRLHYGPVRLWGSAAFIVASWIGGELLEREGEAIVLWVLVGAASLIAGGSWLLPDARRRGTSDEQVVHTIDRSTQGDRSTRGDPSVASTTDAVGDGSSSPPLEHHRRASFTSFLVVAGLMHMSHAVLYAFGTQHWRATGLDEGTAGLLWAESVLAEIVLFAIAPRATRRLGARGLWILAGAAGVIRWTVLGATTSLPLLVLVQALHGLTFGALHLGAMAYIRTDVPARARSRATTWYSAAGAGIALGVGLPLAGVLYDALAGQAYWAMTLCSGLGLVLTLVGIPKARGRPDQQSPVSSSRQPTSKAS